MIRDPYNSKNVHENWLARLDVDAVENLSKKNAEILVAFVKDMSIGLNISKLSKKGGRSPIRLNHLRQKVMFVMRRMQERGIKDITKVNQEHLHKLFEDMRSGSLPNKLGKPYLSTGDYIKDFKTFWHWYQKVEKKKGNHLEDVCEELSTRGEKPKFVYFTEKDFEALLEKASIDLKPVLVLAFVSGARPSEVINIIVGDFSQDFKSLNIRDEISKTFGRKMRFMMGADRIRDYVEKMNLSKDDFIARMSLSSINKELRRLGKELFQPEQIKFKNLSLSDFRHSSCCFWLPHYKSENAMKYKFGWKKSDKIHYYSEFLGMKDTITEDDMYLDITKTELEKQIAEIKEMRATEKMDNDNKFKDLRDKYIEVVKQYNKLADQVLAGKI